MGAIDDLVDANRLNVQLLASVPALLLLAVGSRLFFTSLYTLRTRDLRSTRAVHAEMAECLTRIERCLLLAGAPRPQSPVAPSLPQSSPLIVQGADGGGGAGGGEGADGGGGAGGGEGIRISSSGSSGGSGGGSGAKGGGAAERWGWLLGSRKWPSHESVTGGSVAKEASKEAAVPFPFTSLMQPPPQQQQQQQQQRQVLSVSELGEFTLLVHSYLLLLDYTSPPFPIKVTLLLISRLSCPRSRAVLRARSLSGLRYHTLRDAGLALARTAEHGKASAAPPLGHAEACRPRKVAALLRDHALESSFLLNRSARSLKKGFRPEIERGERHGLGL